MEYDQDDLAINEQVTIPLAELDFRFSRSGGPGGQHVNTSATQVELLFDVARSPSLTDSQRARVSEALHTRMDSEGVLHVTASSSRSQHQNRQEAINRLGSLLRNALRKRRLRKPTRPSRAAKRRRLEGKKRHGQKNQARRQSNWDQ